MVVYFIKLFGRREVTEHPISAISVFGASQTDTHKGIGNAAFSSFKKSAFLVCKYPEDRKCFSLCLDIFCVLADKLMEGTEELCLQREQKEVSSSQANFLQLPCGRAGRLGVVGLKACSGREACGGTRVSSQSLGPVNEEKNKVCAITWGVEVYPCSLSLLLSMQ